MWEEHQQKLNYAQHGNSIDEELNIQRPDRMADIDSALDLMGDDNDNDDNVLLGTPPRAQHAQVALQSSSTTKKKKKTTISKTKSAGNVGFGRGGELKLNMNQYASAPSGVGEDEYNHMDDDENSSPMRGRIRRRGQAKARAERENTTNMHLEEKKAGFDANYPRPWRDAKKGKVQQKAASRVVAKERPVAVFHPKKSSHGIFKSSKGQHKMKHQQQYQHQQDDYNELEEKIEAEAEMQFEMQQMQQQEQHTPIKTRIQKKKKKHLISKTKQIEELRSEYSEALDILRDVVGRMQDQEALQEDLSPMLKVSERSERAFWKTRAIKCAKWLQT